jgi:hypothetical protein
MNVGDIVYLKPLNNNARYCKDGILNHIKQGEVVKVGKKYFYIKGYERQKFGIEEMHDISEYCAGWQVYHSIQEIHDEVEHGKLSDEIRKYFSVYGKVSLSLSKLRKIKEVIECQE